MRALALALLVLACASTARAHGGRPQTQSVLLASDGSGRVVSVATFGLLEREREGAPWTWSCQEAIPDAVAGIASPGVLVGDALLLAGNFGLVRGSGTGCAWIRDEATRDRFVPDVVVAPDGRVVTLTGDSGLENRLYESRDAGLSFAPFGAPLPAEFLPERVRFAPSDPARIYVVGQRRVAGSSRLRGVAVRSDDGGASWTEHDVGELQIDESVVRGLAVHPGQPDQLWIVVQGSESDRLLRTDDGARTWTEVLDMEALPMAYARPFALVIVPGGDVWFGNTAEGLYALRGSELTHEDKYAAVACLTLDGRTVWMCADGLEDGFAIARFSLDADYEPIAVATLGAIERRSCGTESDCVCDAWWDDFLSEVQREAEIADAGPPCVPSIDAGAGLDGGVSDAGSAPRASSGCSVGHGAHRSGLVIGLAALLLLRRRRRR